MKRMTFPLLAVAIVVALTLAWSLESSRPSGAVTWPSKLISTSDCKPYLTSNSSARVTTSSSYIEVAVLGAREAMYTPAQVAKKHPTSGEVMVSGRMNSGSGSMAMGGGASMAHLEVHICSKNTGAAVTDAMPTITLKSTHAGAMTIVVPVAMMRGFDGAVGDTHYGNNVAVAPGGRYKVVVTTKGESAHFTLTARRMSN
ncbi:MAG: hypothetical protein HIU84_07105 [Acidobacteria bacterium]|nr:hypothetical protein [Acidobacteriota bacterium]